ncbi:hypothetical protein AAFC00_006141 [Neodothiora populina]|uniref:MYB transcription factor n=1 Tax=Neodothiora populina TaxID=2781224 RepID=A0ABR3P4G2_9PEZI
MANNSTQNSRERNIQPQNSQALSLPPSQLSIPPGITIPPSYSNPYQHSPYPANPSPFAFPSHQGLSHQNPFGQHNSISQSQSSNAHVPQSPGLHNPRKRSITELDSASTLSSNYPLDHHGLFSPTDSAKGIHGNTYGIAGPSSAAGPSGAEPLPQGGETSATPKPKKGRTNTPWTPAEEHRLKVMRDAGNSWSEIAKTFPTRTEGSVKKHWYKDMHYAEFAEDESAALLAAIKEYESSKWKVIGQKVGKPAKACEQYAKEHFGTKS